MHAEAEGWFRAYLEIRGQSHGWRVRYRTDVGRAACPRRRHPGRVRFAIAAAGGRRAAGPSARPARLRDPLAPPVADAPGGRAPISRLGDAPGEWRANALC